MMQKYEKEQRDLTAEIENAKKRIMLHKSDLWEKMTYATH